MNKVYKAIIRLIDRIKSVDVKAVRISIIVAVLFAMVWVIYGFHLNDFTSKFREVMSDLILARTESESESISSEFSTRCSVVMHGARSVAKVPKNEYEKGIPEVLTSLMEDNSFSSMVFIDNNGVVYFADGSIAKDYDTDPIVEICDDFANYTPFNNKEGYFNSEGGLGIISPVIYRGVKKGHLLAVCSYDLMVKTENYRRNILHDEIILDDAGNVVAQIFENAVVDISKKGVDFFDTTQSVLIAEEQKDFTFEYGECMAANIPGRYTAQSDLNKTTFIFYPIEGCPGWSVMNCYPEASIKAETKEIQLKALTMFMFIVFLMIFAATTIIRYVGKEQRRVTELEFLDGLTGVYNRNAFVAHSETVLKENKNLPYYMICFDVINFRIINETYGHERSDVIIKAMAEACKEAFGQNEVFGRLTADVFVALTIDDGEEEERIRFIENRIAEEGKKVYINHPIKIKRGRYEVVNIAESINRMIDKANIARKYINNNSNSASCQYSDDLMNDARKAEEIESKMEAALVNGEFKPYLQGKFNMVENHVVGAEALVRWVRPDGSIVPPGDFIPLFEQNGFIERVDFYMLEEICKYIRRMLDENREVYKISVNQSRYLMNDPEYVNRVKEILLKYKIPVGLIELELTETVFFHEKDRMIKMMNDLKLMNVNLSIDDFGSGYSSFNILKDVPFDVLKIDREFLTDAVHTEKGKWILKEIVDMAHGLGMSVICEGVESQEHIDLLISIDCHYAQGFFYARPIPMEEFIEKYNTVKQG